ncbi:putative eukaryotic translation initiation factor 3 subunit B, RNA-binding domain superfamily [Helianthus anomalus]
MKFCCLGRFGVIKENDLWMPIEKDTRKTRGYCFIEYNTPQRAGVRKKEAVEEEWERWVNKWKRYHEEQTLRDREATDVEEAEQVDVEELLDVTEEILPDVGIF